MEPRPWSEDDATEIEKALLRAGRADGPRKGADVRLLAMLHKPAPSPINPVTFPHWIKIGLAAVVAGGGALVTQQLLRPRQAPASAMPALVIAADARPAAPAPVPGPVADDSVETTRTEASPTPAPAVGRPQNGTRPIKPAEPARGHSLGEETQALDRARVALDAHRPDEALRVLDEYRRRFPQGRLRPESMILRLAALVQADRPRAADSLASQLLSDPTYQPYVPRIESLLKERRP